MNKVIISGNISTEIDLRQTAKGTPVAKFNVAVKRVKDEVDFLPVVVWNQQAENVKEFCNKGSKLLVEGRIQAREYEKDGEKRYVTEIIAEKVEFISASKKTPNEAKNDEKQVYEDFGERVKTESQIGEQIQIDESDLPF